MGKRPFLIRSFSSVLLFPSLHSWAQTDLFVTQAKHLYKNITENLSYAFLLTTCFLFKEIPTKKNKVKHDMMQVQQREKMKSIESLTYR